jgi:predicted enzyme related to lactoylglutathione lyase
MTADRGDAFESLRLPPQAADPDPVFAAHLRRQVERALAQPLSVPTAGGTGTVDTDPTEPAAEQAPPAEQARAGDLAYATLCVPDADRAGAFYGTVLGWEVAPGSVPEGRQVTNTIVPTGIWGGHEKLTVRCCWQVDDVDEALERVRAAGGSAEPPTDQPYGRLAACVDDQGLGFDLYAPAAGADPGPRLPSNGTRQGDLSYLTLELPDRTRALAFYRSVLGWRTPDDSDPVDVHPMLGLADTGPGRAVPMWKVDNVAAAVQRVRAAGGSATDPEQRPYGLTAICSDDQGMPFYLGDA